MTEKDTTHLVSRLELVIELIDGGEYHMAVAKLLADIAALKGDIPKHYNCNDCGMVMATNKSMRPNGKFCQTKCAELVKKHRLAKGSGNNWYNSN